MLKEYITYWLIDDYREELTRNELIIEFDGTEKNEHELNELGFYWFDEWNLWVDIESVNIYFEQVRKNYNPLQSLKEYFQ